MNNAYRAVKDFALPDQVMAATWTLGAVLSALREKSKDTSEAARVLVTISPMPPCTGFSAKNSGNVTLTRLPYFRRFAIVTCAGRVMMAPRPRTRDGVNRLKARVKVDGLSAIDKRTLAACRGVDLIPAFLPDLGREQHGEERRVRQLRRNSP